MKINGYLTALAGLVCLTGRALCAEPAVVDGDNVLVRAQPTRFSEIITRLDKGTPVTVLEEITIEKKRPDDEAQWSRVAMPEGLTVWVHGAFVDAATGTVTANRLNLRAGPGENFSVLGQIDQGATIKSVSTKGDWIEIQAPETTHAFIASRLLRKGEAPVAAPTEEMPIASVEPATSTNETTLEPATGPGVEETPLETASVTEATEPMLAEDESLTEEAPVMEGSNTNPPFSEPSITLIEEPPPKRIVMREGIVKGTVSIQAPTHFELVSPFTGETINYLYTTSTNLVLKKYRGLHIIVTGEEGLDKRWPNTPVITIQRIQVLEE